MPDHTVSYLFTDRYANASISAVVWHLVHDQRTICKRLPFAVDSLKVSVLFKRVDTAQLSRENLSSLCSSCCQNLSSSLCAHSCTETMNLCMGSLLWLKCHLHNKTPPCFLCWFSNNTVSYTVGISPTACTKSAIFRRFFYAVAKIGHHTHYIKKLAFRQGFFWCFLFFITKKLSPTYPQSYPQFFYSKMLWIKVIPKLWITCA